MTQLYNNARSNEYATHREFCHIYLEQMNSLYLLSLLLTSDSNKAEHCFLSAFDDSVSNRFVFKERASFWARRSLIVIRDLASGLITGERHSDSDAFALG